MISKTNKFLFSCAFTKISHHVSPFKIFSLREKNQNLRPLNFTSSSRQLCMEKFNYSAAAESSSVYDARERAKGAVNIK
jgi:hypothetical protein